MLVRNASVLVDQIEAFAIKGLPLNPALPAKVELLSELVGTLPKGTDDADICGARNELDVIQARAEGAVTRMIGMISKLSEGIYVENQRQRGWYDTCVNVSDALSLIRRLSHPTFLRVRPELRTIEESVDQSKTRCLHSLREDVISFADAREYERLAKIIGEELIPMQRLGDCSEELVECEMHLEDIFQADSYMEVADPLFFERWSQLRKFARVFSNATGSKAGAQLNETLAGMQRKIKAREIEFSRLVQVTTSPVFVSNILEAFKMVRQMSSTGRVVMQAQINTSLQSAIVTFDHLLIDKQFDVSAVGLNRLFGSEDFAREYFPYLSAATLDSWNRHKDSLRARSEEALHALTDAWESNPDPDAVAACQKEYGRLCGQDALGAAISERDRKSVV